MDNISQTTFSKVFSSTKMKFAPKSSINSMSALVQILACRLDGAKPLYEPMVVSLPKHICSIRSQWVNIKSYQLCTLKNVVLNERLYLLILTSFEQHFIDTLCVNKGIK